jgi:hypothetical protein
MTEQQRVVDLPRRPRIVPGLAVLRRRAGEIQVGLDPSRATVVGGLPESVVAVAGRLTGHRTAEDLLAEVGADGPAFEHLLRLLGDEGLLEDATTEVDEHQGSAVAVHGEGRLAVSVACLLAAAGVGWVHVAARGAVGPEDTGSGYLAEDLGRSKASAAAAAVRRVGRRVRTGRFDARRRPDLVLLTDAVVPDPELVGVLTADGVPHLPVHIRDGVGIVGPLVVPGVTSCLRCADLHRSEIDGCWPSIATQLAGRPQHGDLACVAATAGFAAAQALESLRWSRSACAHPQAWNTTVEIDIAAARTRYRGWRRHPACPCRA